MIGKPLQVLLVEDDADDAFLLRDMLEDTGSAFELSVAGRLAEAISMAGLASFDVILLDLSLPDSRGLETFAALHERLPATPVVVLTGLDDETMAVRAVQRGAQDYLVKGQVEGMLLLRSLRYAVERQRAQRFQDLLAERELLNTSISQMTDGIVITDADWRIVLANRAAQLLLNLPEATDDGGLWEHLAGFELTPGADELRQGSEAMTAFEMVRPDTNPPLYLDARLSRLAGAGGEPGSAVLMVRDVTDARLARHIQADFMTAVPHKLRTPLSVLLGYIVVARRMPADQLVEKWPEISEILEGEVRQLVDMVQRLLDFEHLTTGDLRAELEPTAPGPVIQSCLSELRVRYPEMALELTVDAPSPIPPLECRPDHLTFVLGELLNNAVRFADKTPVRLQVQVQHEDDATCRLTVTDNGPGIPHEHYDHIFDDFYQLEEHATGQVPGWGVGLRMARQLVKAYGGDLTVNSRLGEGSVFSFTLPCRQESTG